MAAANSNFTIAELMGSQHQEDQEVARRCDLTVWAVVVELKPVLQYLASPIRLASMPREKCPWLKNTSLDLPLDFSPPKAVAIPNCFDYKARRKLFLSKGGAFFTAEDCGIGAPPHYHDSSSGDLTDISWRLYPFESLILGLRNVLVEAKSKREHHLDTIKARLAMLDRIAEVIQTSKTKI